MQQQNKRKKKISLKKLLLSACLLLFMAFAIIISCNSRLRLNLFSSCGLSNKKVLDSDFSVHFIDVAQGDCALINNKDANILIDTGDEIYSEKVIKYLKSYNIYKLDYIIISHPHLDHIGGLLNIINGINVNSIILNDIPFDKCRDDYDLKKLYNICNDKNIAIIHPDVFSEININGMTLEFMFNKMYDNLNDSSLVVRAEYNDKSFLFTGDIEKNSEKALCQYMKSATVLKIPHHGSNTSSTVNFIDIVKPEVSVISCGSNNTFGHPGDEVVSRLSKYSNYIFRTDISGNIVFKVIEDKLIIKTENGDEYAVSG